MVPVFLLLPWTVLAKRGSEEPNQSWSPSLQYAASVCGSYDQKGKCANGRVAFDGESRPPWWHVLQLEIVRPVFSRWPSCQKMAVVLAYCCLSAGEIGKPTAHSRSSYATGPVADGYFRPRTDPLLGLYKD